MAVAVGRTSVSDHTKTLKVGDQAPDFELSSHRGGERVRLGGFRGKKNVVLAFYPLDWTPVCSVHMPAYEAEIGDFERYDTQVLGISVDSAPSHTAFAKSLGGIEKYPLLADFNPKGEVAKAYGVYIDEKGYSERAIFIIDKEGILRYIDVHKIGEAPENGQLLEVLRELP
jgi:peroxiredoxin (alkyl hydroperoxide reductase subunit C)